MIAEKATNIIQEDREEMETAEKESSQSTVESHTKTVPIAIPSSLQVPGADPALIEGLSASPNVFQRRPRASSARNSPLQAQSPFGAITE